MPVSFRIAEIEVEAFRGLQSCALKFPQGTPTYLIGPNNAGKSTLVRALALAFRAGGFHQFQPEPYDFHVRNGTHSKSFRIAVRLEPTNQGSLPAVQGVGNPVYVHGIEVRGSTETNGRLTHRHALFGEDGKRITFSRATALKGATKDEFKDHQLGWRQVYARPDDIRDYLPEVWLIHPNQTESALYRWSTGPLQKLARILSQRFLETNWSFDDAGKAREMPKTLESAHAFFHRAVQAFPFWQNDMRPKLESALRASLGGAPTISLSPSIEALEEWLRQQLALSFGLDASGTLTPLSCMGDGWQCVVRLAALETLAQYPEEVSEPVVLLLEEPETHLHPHMRKRLGRTLQRLSDGGWTVIGTTHSPELVNFNSRQLIVRVLRSGSDVTASTFDTTGAPDEAKLQEKLDERGNHELLFSDRVILCEGKDDVFAVRNLLDAFGIDHLGLNLTVADCGSVSAQPSYARMAIALGIPWYSISDEDKLQDGSINPKTQGVRDELQKLRRTTDAVDMWSPTLEGALGLTGSKATPAWQRTSLAGYDLAQLDARFPNLTGVGKNLKVWLTA